MAMAANVIPFPTKRPKSLVILNEETADRLVQSVKDSTSRQKAMTIRAIQTLIDGMTVKESWATAFEFQDIAKDCAAMSEILVAASERILANRAEFI